MITKPDDTASGGISGTISLKNNLLSAEMQMEPKSLSGESDIRRFSVQPEDGTHADATQAIIPVVVQDIESYRFRFVGTAFFVMVNGLIVTAKHVLDEVRKEGKVVGPIGIIHFVGNNEFYMRNIRESYEYPTSDVAVALLDQPKHKISGKPLLNKVLTLSLNGAKTGDRVFTYAHPKTSVDINEKNIHSVFFLQSTKGL